MVYLEFTARVPLMTLASLPITLFDPRGRCNRKGLLTVSAGMLAAEIVAGAAIWLGLLSFEDPAMVAVKAVLMLAAISAAAQRLHDTGRSAWWIVSAFIGLFAGGLALCFGLLQFMPIASMQPGGSVFLIVTVAITIPMLAMMMWLHFAPGDPRANRYGPLPAGLGFARRERRNAPARNEPASLPA